MQLGVSRAARRLDPAHGRSPNATSMSTQSWRGLRAKDELCQADGVADRQNTEVKDALQLDEPPLCAPTEAGDGCALRRGVTGNWRSTTRCKS